MARTKELTTIIEANAVRYFRKLGETDMNESHTVVYRKGGTHNATWHRALPAKSKEEAELQSLQIRRMGFKTIVNTTEFWDTIGLPIGWCNHCDPLTGEYTDCGCS